ncbi:MAG: 16S rRNA (adenine(1518)-N(6)/adenine(1519)-N(6))-dimethyltransferase RsmA [Bacteroidetes bacterium]|nr:16S rRNA (adenine(1518)-N(6)/adenine(1519)-N(6))-dimethyltransferase RsmA [Bacteroidota bacterium]HET6244181.1 16S rRNA (adenine(1518)-N(6)/adenine(1519)-N(6))-dimethyltransferase RsmA [Bacteroidia bacterium]
MEKVRAKKHLGQHFLNDEGIAKNIVDSLTKAGYKKVMEIGPGMGVLTKYLILDKEIELSVIELDRESIEYLKNHFPELDKRIISADFLKFPLEEYFHESFAIIGNFPYNISSQILFKVLEHKESIPELVGMFQKEVAQRLASPPKNKAYGILSVLLQAYYDIEYLFTVNEDVFTPPPKVKSAVIRIKRNNRVSLGCDDAAFKKVIKMGFNQRRKTLRNALKAMLPEDKQALESSGYLTKRAEELSVEDFVELTKMLNV